MQVFNVDGLRFSFPEKWGVAKYDEWIFYRKNFCKVHDGIKSLDLLAICPDKVLWLIEVKDYRSHRRTKTIDIADEVCKKIFDTLAAIIPAKINSNETNEKEMASRFVKAKSLRVVLHLEQPQKHSKLFPRAIDPANVKQKMKNKLKSIDAHPVVVETKNMRGLNWSVA